MPIGLPRLFSALGNFAESRSGGLPVIMQKKTVSLLRLVHGSHILIKLNRFHSCFHKAFENKFIDIIPNSNVGTLCKTT